MPETAPESNLFRLFIALPVAPEIQATLLRFQQELRARLPEHSVRWTKPDQLHLTLKFLGDVPSESLETLRRSLHDACANFAPMHLRAERLGFFPNARRPRIIWVSVADAHALLPKLHAAVHQAARSLGDHDNNEKAFQGHLTLGRIHQLRPREARLLEESSHHARSRTFGEWTASAIELIHSDLQPAGSRYTRLAVVPLAGCSPKV